MDFAGRQPAQRWFQSALPVRGAITRGPCACPRQAFQSALPVRGAILALSPPAPYYTVSIRAPCEGSDPGPPGRNISTAAVSIRAPCEGSDVRAAQGRAALACFNPRSL